MAHTAVLYAAAADPPQTSLVSLSVSVSAAAAASPPRVMPPTRSGSGSGSKGKGKSSSSRSIGGVIKAAKNAPPYTDRWSGTPILPPGVKSPRSIVKKNYSGQEVRLQISQVKIDALHQYEHIVQNLDLHDQLTISQRSNSDLTAERDDLVGNMERRVADIEQEYKGEIYDLSERDKQTQSLLAAISCKHADYEAGNMRSQNHECIFY